MSKKSDGAAARLKEWLDLRGLSIARFCADIGIHPLTPYRWRRGKKPTLAVAVKIETFTSGAVSCASWMNEEEVGS